ncbi:helix-turn-helix transcriptional regulator [Halarchaeum sp. P4]|uniref:helix-turn-helix transcriptional regulator n=1 Tax=Halarchaeum sp. P4 TaxID=3421639 RepID=UPI003EBF9D8F
MQTGNTGDVGTRTGDETIETVAYLARSEHRVRVLELLARGVRERETLLEETGVTRVTLSRVLSGLEERGWIAKSGGEYELTGFGALVYEDLSRLLGTVSLGETYPDVVERLPTEWFGFDVCRLADGELVADEHADPLAATRVVANAVREADTVRALVGSFTSLPMYAYAEATHAGRAGDATVVFDADASALVREDAAIAEQTTGIERRTGSDIYYRTGNDYPCNVDLVDGETVYIGVPRERGGGFDIIESTDDAVCEWARETFERERADATPLSDCRPSGP